jgi:triosephosphate isomerase
MFGSLQSATELAEAVREGVTGLEGVETGVFPPHIHLQAVAGVLAGSKVATGAQDLSQEEEGAHTGDVSARMIKEVGCHYVLAGHSERRADHGESNELVAKKFHRAKATSLEPVLCVGETLAQREAGETLQVVEAQIRAVFDEDVVEDIIIAYEPVWAIGTGKTATPEQAQEVHAFIRNFVASMDEGIAGDMRILYGGSVKPENAAELFAQDDIDGGLVGGASLKAESFIAICKAAT